MMKQWMTGWLGMVVFCVGLAVHADDRAQDVREAIVKVYTVHNLPDYYNPWNMRGTQSSTGSGCIIEGRRILTNGHVVRDQTFIQVRRFGESRRYQARVLFVSHQADLALLTVDDPTFFDDVEPLSFGELPFPQDEVNVYGFPVGGDTLSITKGVISRIEHQQYVHSSVPLLAVQIDAAINPGNSGGPAIVDGRIVGVAMQGVPHADSIGYIVPVPVIQHFFADIRNGRLDGIPSLGIVPQVLENPDMRRHYGMEEEQTGVLVAALAHGSSVDGILQPEDVLLSIQGHLIADDGTVEFRARERTSFSYYVQENQVGETLKMDVLRDGESMSLEIPLNHPMERDWLIPMEQYDILPTYYIYGGVVFVPLTKNLMRMWGPNWANAAPKEFVVQLQNNIVTEEQDEHVIGLRVLAADVNQGFHGESNWFIETVDGVKVRNLGHLIELVEAGEGNEFVEFRNPVGRRIILDRQKVKKEQESILAIYRIPEDRSGDLL